MEVRRRSRFPIWHLLAHAVLMAGTVVMVLPMLWMLVTSFKPPTEIAIWPPDFLPHAPTFENYPFGLMSSPKSQLVALYNNAVALFPTISYLGQRINDLPDVPLN